MITKEEQEGTFVAIEKFRILTAVVVAQIYPSDEMTQNYTHTLYQCHLPDFDTVCKIVNTGPHIRSNHWRKLGKRNLGPLCTILGVSCESIYDFKTEGLYKTSFLPPGSRVFYIVKSLPDQTQPQFMHLGPNTKQFIAFYSLQFI